MPNAIVHKLFTLSSFLLLALLCIATCLVRMEDTVHGAARKEQTTNRLETGGEHDHMQYKSVPSQVDGAARSRANGIASSRTELGPRVWLPARHAMYDVNEDL